MVSNLFRNRARRRAATGSRASARVVAAALMTVAGLAGTARAEDMALCIGVNEYPGLRPGANLGGCVNDATMFADKLRTLYGFRRPMMLTNSGANKQAILNAISSMKGKVGPNDRVVIYFAGHGTVASNGESVILPGDAKDNDENFDIQVDELYNAVKDLGSGGVKTIVLDSCHSGGMVRSAAGLRSFNKRTPRYYVRSRVLNQPASNPNTGRDIKKWQEDDVNDTDNLNDVIPSGATGICYFTAALKNQVANETDLGGQRHGIFTYNLANALTGRGELWQDLSSGVSERVMSATDNEQKPLLHPTTFLREVVFGGRGGAPKPQPQPLGLDALYNLSSPDPSKVALRRFPDITPVPVGKATYFEITVGEDGFLLLLNRDPKGLLEVVFPKSPSVQALQVRRGQKIRVPSAQGRVVRPDTPGVDGLKAILFTNSDTAMAMLKPFLDNGGFRAVPVASAVRAWKEDDDDKAAPTSSFFTSELSTLIVEGEGKGTGVARP